MDTEQSFSDHDSLCRRAIRRSGLDPECVLSRLHSGSILGLSIPERREFLESKIDEFHPDIVILDGGADFLASPNDETEGLASVHWILALATKHNFLCVVGIHENPSGNETGKTRGHFGSELTRKAYCNARIQKDEDEISTLSAANLCRGRPLPKSESIAFGWDASEGWHKYLGRASGLKADKRERTQADKRATEFDLIFSDLGESIEYKALLERICEKLNVKPKTAQARITEWNKGVLKKTDDGKAYKNPLFKSASLDP